jgi:hypothetical protein
MYLTVLAVVKATFIGAASAAVTFGIELEQKIYSLYFLFKSRFSSGCHIWYFSRWNDYKWWKVWSVFAAELSNYNLVFI